MSDKKENMTDQNASGESGDDNNNIPGGSNTNVRTEDGPSGCSGDKDKSSGPLNQTVVNSSGKKSEGEQKGLKTTAARVNDHVKQEVVNLILAFQMDKTTNTPSCILEDFFRRKKINDFEMRQECIIDAYQQITKDLNDQKQKMVPNQKKNTLTTVRLRGNKSGTKKKAASEGEQSTSLDRDKKKERFTADHNRIPSFTPATRFC